MKKNLILIDYHIDSNKDNGFVWTLSNVCLGEWIVKEKITNNLHGGIINQMVRFLWYFLFPLQIISNRYKYDIVKKKWFAN